MKLHLSPLTICTRVGVPRDGPLSTAMAGPCREQTLHSEHERPFCAALHASGTQEHPEGESEKPKPEQHQLLHQD